MKLDDIIPDEQALMRENDTPPRSTGTPSRPGSITPSQLRTPGSRVTSGTLDRKKHHLGNLSQKMLRYKYRVNFFGYSKLTLIGRPLRTALDDRKAANMTLKGWAPQAKILAMPLIGRLRKFPKEIFAKSEIL